MSFVQLAIVTDTRVVAGLTRTCIWIRQDGAAGSASTVSTRRRVVTVTTVKKDTIATRQGRCRIRKSARVCILQWLIHNGSLGQKTDCLWSDIRNLQLDLTCTFFVCCLVGTINFSSHFFLLQVLCRTVERLNFLARTYTSCVRALFTPTSVGQYPSFFRHPGLQNPGYMPVL